MKTFSLTTIIALFLLLSINGIQAQTTQTKLNQVELMKQFIGSWKGDIAKDTTLLWEVKPYGIGLEGSIKYVSKGKTVLETKQLWGLDKVHDKLIVAEIIKGMDLELYASWFISKYKFEFIRYSDISNPEQINFKVEGEIISKDMFVEKMIINNKLVRTDTYTRVK